MATDSPPSSNTQGNTLSTPPTPVVAIQGTSLPSPYDTPTGSYEDIASLVVPSMQREKLRESTRSNDLNEWASEE